ncbi:unnamed protein product [Symbiodinium necroappetens]|uniref:protein-serine/threonine phosphatase n=1 Tax=Symbiodinium necroappetens TaxID=1628268 RepID=A0A812W5D4_9DINO|nr:unnamed protein product [Symbiodinium necroappetens]
MGAQLPKAVESTVVESQGSGEFDVAVAEMNGWRTSMEDAHLIMLGEGWGVFGVFDGHGGGACSEFAARRLREEIEANGCPDSDEAVKKLFIKIDQEFLDSAQSSGTTATMCIVRKPKEAGGKHRLHVINAGDSRTLLGKRDGSIVDGGGTDKGLTTDHKPDHPAEKARIERCGGKVEIADGGVARVNGNLSVSRGFGDKDEKMTGGPGPEDRPVTVDPEMSHFECDESDFLLLVCDGVSEGNFPNAEVVKLVASTLGSGKDMREAARAVCHKAVECDSKDNITCMGVLLTGGSSSSGKRIDFHPGPMTSIGHKDFRAAYEASAQRAGLSLVEAAMQRYDLVSDQLKADVWRLFPTKMLLPAAARSSSGMAAACMRLQLCWLLLHPIQAQQDAFHDETRDGKLEMSLKERYEYWEKTYADPRSASGKDWYGSWRDFRRDVAGSKLRKNDEILVIGCGNSALPADLAKQGFKHVTAADYSQKAIELQKRRFPKLKWVLADARNMPEFRDKSFDIVIEKALMDGEGAYRQWPLMFMEISRVLRPGGRFISISLGQPEELDTEEFFNNSTYGWDVRYKLSYDDYYVYTMTKHASSKEVAPSDALRAELDKIGLNPPADGRREWFEKKLGALPDEKDSSGPGGMNIEELKNMMGKGKGGGKGQSQGTGGYDSAPSADEEVETQEDGYTWSQKGEEVQIAIKLPQATTKKEVKVVFKQTTIAVLASGKTLLDGTLGGKVETDECTWCLVNGGTELNVMLTKQSEKDNWKGLLK